jgi:heat shock protein HslJ
MRFSPQSSDLAGTDWTVIGYNNGRGGVVSVIIGTELTATFGADGTLTGSAGCNNYSAGYEVDGNNISIGLPISTLMACAEPEGIMEQEQEYLTALGTAATYQISGDRMEMRTAEGSTAVTFEAAK